MTLNVYLSGEIHTDWREQIIDGGPRGGWTSALRPPP